MQMDSLKPVLRFSLLLILLLIFSCEDALEYNPLDPDNNPDFVEPETFLTMNDLEGSVLNTSTVTITWQGNDLVTEYAYSLNDNWSEWSADTSVTLNYLDEGDYTFSVKGRYASGDEDTTPATASFSVDMVGAKGIRVYPLLTEMSTSANIYIYAEGVEELVFFSFQIQFNPSILSVDVEDIVRGSLISGIADYAFLPKEISAGLIEVSFTALGSIGVSGTGSLATLPFSANGSGSSTLQIINPQYGYIDGTVEPVTESANGMVVIE